MPGCDGLIGGDRRSNPSVLIFTTSSFFEIPVRALLTFLGSQLSYEGKWQTTRRNVRLSWVIRWFTGQTLIVLRCRTSPSAGGCYVRLTHKCPGETSSSSSMCQASTKHSSRATQRRQDVCRFRYVTRDDGDLIEDLTGDV